MNHSNNFEIFRMIKPGLVYEGEKDNIFKTKVPITRFLLQDKEELYKEFTKKRQESEELHNPGDLDLEGRSRHEQMCIIFFEDILGDYLNKIGFSKRKTSIYYGPTKTISVDGPAYYFTEKPSFGIQPSLLFHAKDNLEAELDISLVRIEEDKNVESIRFILSYLPIEVKGNGIEIPRIIKYHSTLYVASTDFCLPILSAYGKLISNLDKDFCEKATMLYKYTREETEHSFPEIFVSKELREKVLKPLWKEYEEKIQSELDFAKFLAGLGI